MSGGLTEPTKKTFNANYETVVQGSTAGALRKSLADLPDDATVVWVDSFEEDDRTLFGDHTPRVTAGLGFKWPASPMPD